MFHCGHYSKEGGRVCFACFLFLAGGCHEPRWGETTGHVEPASYKPKPNSIVQRTQSGRSQASENRDQHPRLAWSLSSDNADSERPGRNLILNERVLQPDALAPQSLKRTKYSWELRTGVEVGLAQ